ncbi:MAG: ABC transporter permease [Gemmatimonadota bacterium]|jgi:predicted permease
MSWRIELSRPAVEALRALPREAQEEVARRIRHLEDGGLPPALSGGGGPVMVPAGGRVLVCVEDAGEGRITVVTLREAEAPAGEAVWKLFVRRIIHGWRGGAMGGWMQDLRYALRSLRKAPGFAAVAVMTLALGIGAATAIFSVADGVLLEPLPYGEPDRVVTIHASWDNFPDKTWVAQDEFQLWHQENRTLEDAALYYRGSATFTDVENPERVGAAAVTPNLFEVLGVEPVVGRTFTWEEAQLPDPPLVLSYDAWQRRYGGDPDVVGRAVEVDGTMTPILGVLPEGFVLPVDYGLASSTDLYAPTYVDLESPAPELGSGGNHGAYVVGRLQDGTSVERARSDLERVQATVEPVGLYAPQRQFRPKVFLARNDVVGAARGTIWLLLGTVAFVLLIACGNVANLLLSRAEGRTGEMAVRSAMGASRPRIVRQLLLESGVLAGLAGVLGVALAAVGVRALLAIDPQAVPRSASVTLDGTVVLFAVAISVGTALLFGTVPALRVARYGAAGPLREQGRGAGPGASGNRTQGLLVASQMAMAVILLTSAGLMGRTFVKLLEVDPGFAPENVLTLRMTTPPAGYPDSEDVVGFYDELLRRVRDIPGVRAAGAARLLPLASTMGDSGFGVEGYEPAPNESMQAEWQFVTPGYLEVMRIPLLAGRTFDGRDRIDGPKTIIVNESLARRYFQDRDPVGGTMYNWGDTLTVVGVVGDVAHNGITAPRKFRYYRPHAQVGSAGNQRSLTLTIETEGAPTSVLEPVRGEIRALDPSIPVSRVETMDEVMSGALAQPRFAMVLLGAFAAIALALAVVGIYGVLSYAVSRRTREIGVRVALGAERSAVIGLVVRQGMVMALLGVAAGTVFALALSGFMEGMLYAVEPNDTATFVGVPLAFASVALVACLVPAARAARVDPARALRYE